MLALELEMRSICAATGATGALVQHGANGASAAAAALAASLPPLLQRERDARHHVPPEQLSQALMHFGGDLDRQVGPGLMLVVVAHPDDEAVGAGAQLARLRDVAVLHVTDGTPMDPLYAQRRGFETRDAYGEARQRESRAALRLVGVPAKRQFCLGIPDGDVPFHLVELSLMLADLLDELRPAVILTHAYEGGHTDHDAIAFGVQLACGILRREGTPAPIVLELTAYHSRNGRRVVHEFLPARDAAGERTVKLSPAARALKARMFARYRTQRRCLRQFSTAIEKFRPAPRYVFTEPPHEGALEYERAWQRMSGVEWRARAARALERLRSRGRAFASMSALPRFPFGKPQPVPTVTAAGPAALIVTQPDLAGDALPESGQPAA
jgi:N-acetylglucosamine malate deacetylase 2